MNPATWSVASRVRLAAIALLCFAASAHGFSVSAARGLALIPRQPMRSSARSSAQLARSSGPRMKLESMPDDLPSDPNNLAHNPATPGLNITFSLHEDSPLRGEIQHLEQILQKLHILYLLNQLIVNMKRLKLLKDKRLEERVD